MANPLDDLIAERKRNGEFYAPASPAAMAAALASAPIVAEDTATHERDARMAADEQKAADLAEIENAKHYTPEQKFAIALQNDRKDREFRQSAANREGDNRDRTATLNEHEQAFREHHAAIGDDLNERQYALSQSEAYLNMAAKRHELNEKTQSNIDAAGFLQESEGIHHSDPDAEAKYAGLVAKYGKAGDNPLVQSRLASFDRDRQNYWTAKQVIDEENRKKDTGKEAQVLAAREQGLFEPGELDYKKGGNNYLHNPDGTLNHDSALAVAADRSARGQGTKAQKVIYNDTLNTFKVLSAKTDRDENEEQIYKSLGADLAEMIKARKVKAAPQGTVVGVPAASGATNLLKGL